MSTTVRHEGGSGVGHDPRIWRITTLRPLVLLIYANAAAATGCFGLALLWILYGQWYTLLQWVLAVLVVGALLSLVAFVGAFLERR